MPRYSYDCKQCAKTVEIVHRYKDTNIKCPTCGSKDITKNMGTPITRIPTFTDKDKKIGSEVKQAIHDNQKELVEARKKISKRVYKKK